MQKIAMFKEGAFLEEYEALCERHGMTLLSSEALRLCYLAENREMHELAIDRLWRSRRMIIQGNEGGI